MAARSDLDDQTHREVVGLMQITGNIADAARRLRIDARTIRRWRERGAAYVRDRENGGAKKPSEERYGKFWIESEQALSQRKVRAQMVLHDLMSDDDPRIRFQAATWLLERTYPDEYGRQNRQIEVSGSVKLDGPEAIKERKAEGLKLIDDLATRRAKRIAKKAAGNGQ